ncbi:Transposon Ty3-G Gag-Pol polyprotein [Stylophora pistillata]|uniref:Transposon Ty3-G Gag-Pol polyprotein n=1 Tax=Stylophora pistillata TaxID=50429 RepID=A0A2B4S510_STYPI|nr:Transposon Ty3-G Gag-Pol polyprotein [Stylophora pistillata]
MLKLSVGGVELEMLIDSGATNNIVDECTWEDLKAKKIKCKSQAAPVDRKLYAYASSNPLPVKGRFTCEVLVEEVDGPTPRVNQVVIISKADGDIRLCIDMRQANKAIIRGRYLIPTVYELLHNMNGSKVFSKLDLKWGYHQLELNPESRQITTFVTHKGLYRDRPIRRKSQSLARNKGACHCQRTDKVESHPHGAEEYIRFAAISATPRELTTREVEEASAANEELKVLREAIKTGRFEKCKEYAPAAGQLCVIGQLVPQANGEVERQNASLMKKIRIAQAEGLDWVKELRRYVTKYRGIDHATTDVQVGDQVLVRQEKRDKFSTPFNPVPFQVVSKTGNSVVVKNPSGTQYSRNTSHVKKFVSPDDPIEPPASTDVITVPETTAVPNQAINCFSNPVGVSDSSIITDDQMTASSEYRDYNQAFYGRLKAVGGDGWCSRLPNSNSEWLQVDIGEVIQACGLATGGDKWEGRNRFVTAFKLSHSFDGISWKTYRNKTGGEVKEHCTDEAHIGRNSVRPNYLTRDFIFARELRLQIDQEPSPIEELKDIEDEMLKMIQSVKFKQVNSPFLNKLKEDSNRIKNERKLLVQKDKTTNFYKLELAEYNDLLERNVTKSYKKALPSTTQAIHKTNKDIATKLQIDDRVNTTANKDAFITLKDHKSNFSNKPTCRLINPTKPEIGKVSKQILGRINTNIARKSNFDLWKNTSAVINWFRSIDNKYNSNFICFDIDEFYPSISLDLLNKALNFASDFDNITADERNIIIHAKSSI